MTKKRVLSALLALCLLLAMFPLAASAEEGHDTQQDNDVASVTVGNKTTYYERFEDAWDAINANQTSTLTLLKDITVGSDFDWCLGYPGSNHEYYNDANVTLKSAGNYTISSDGSLSVVCGVLTVESGIFPHGVSAESRNGYKATVNIKGGTFGHVYVSGDKSEANISGGTITATEIGGSGSTVGLTVYGGGTANISGGRIAAMGEGCIGVEGGTNSTIHISDPAEIFAENSGDAVRFAGDSLIMTGGTVKATSNTENDFGTGIALGSGSKATISGGTIQAGNALNIAGRNTTCTVTAGTFSSADAGVYVGSGSTCAISGCTIEAGEVGVQVNDGTVTIENCTITATGKDDEAFGVECLGHESNTNIKSGTKIISSDCGIAHAGGSLTINGGTIKGDRNAVSMKAWENDSTDKLVITDGDFSSKNTGFLMKGMGGSTEISGGTFTGGKYGMSINGNGDLILLRGGSFKGDTAAIQGWPPHQLLNNESTSGENVGKYAFFMDGKQLLPDELQKDLPAGTVTVKEGKPVATLWIWARLEEVTIDPPAPAEPEIPPTDGEDSGDTDDGGADTQPETNADTPTTKKVVTLTVTANPANVLSSVNVTADNGLSVTKTADKTNEWTEWTADLPAGEDVKTYTFTAELDINSGYVAAPATCQVKSDGTVVQPEKPPVTPPSSGTTTPPAPTPVEEVNKTPAVSGGTANATVSSSEGAGLVAEAQKPATGEVTVKVAPTDEADTVNVTLPASTAAGVGAAKADLVVETPLAHITLPSESLTSLGSGAGNVTVSAAVNSDETVSITVKKDNTTVTTLAQPMKAAIPAENATSTTVAVLVNEDGTETIIPKSISGKDEVSLLLDGSAKIKLKDNGKAFDDTQGHWANTEGAIGFVSSRELFKGTSDTSFSPEQAMTRGMMVAVLHRLESTPKGGSVSFGDVSADAYFAEAVAWGNENDIVKGDGSNFLPDNNVTREQLATFLYRYASKYGVDTAGRTNLTSFPDSGNVSSYAKDALEWAYHIGLIKGSSDGSLNPTGSAKRGEVAAILMRFVEYINK